MTKFKCIPLFFLIVFTFFQPLFSQSQNSGLAQWEVLITRQIKYPIEALRARKEGVVVVSLGTDEKGNLGEINLEKKAAPYFDDQVLAAVESMRHLWSPNMLEDRKAGGTYFLVYNFIMIQEGTSGKQERIKSAINLIQKGKADKALKIADRLVNENPYDTKSLELRSQIHRQLGMEEEATTDLLAYQKLQIQVLNQIDIKVFGQVSTRQVTGTIPSRSF
ncbi:MAG: TonB family protein [Algoriphagus sp.]|jgi:TonB family protein|uniref:TonB family protein n=1 Tax=Algoriphagus sp. TaxID=1872435 RepID=UPI00272F81AD|nr:TonB family protein [Algoriphagus sp.]MDP2041903.1 TonB family protein [Algoriphagus sp.]MDP3472672.1 TonB family protein [Algoriphagus sp.]